MNTNLTKRVKMVELFYDLVFVYMISQATGLIHHLHHGVVSPLTFLLFVLIMVIFINSWMIQTVFTNRYGNSSWTNITFSFIDMAIILYMSNSFSAVFDSHLSAFLIAAGLLSLTLGIQYTLVSFKVTTNYDKAITHTFAMILFIRTLLLVIGGLLGNRVGMLIAMAEILFGWIAPAFTGKFTKYHPVIFSHLLERLTNLIIIMFGEMIIGIAEYFTQNTLTIWSVLIFIIVVALFFTYIVEFDHLIDEHQTGETGNLLIYLHYLILFGLSLITVALKFINEETANELFAIGCLYLGLILFYLGLMIANYYNKKALTNATMISLLGITVCGYLVSLWNASSFNTVVTITVIVTLINAISTTYLIYKD